MIERCALCTNEQRIAPPWRWCACPWCIIGQSPSIACSLGGVTKSTRLGGPMGRILNAGAGATEGSGRSAAGTRTGVGMGMGIVGMGLYATAGSASIIGRPTACLKRLDHARACSFILRQSGFLPGAEEEQIGRAHV